MVLPFSKIPYQNTYSRYNHSNEKSSPGFYSVLLDDYDVEVEVTTTKRAGFHKYKFNKKYRIRTFDPLDGTSYITNEESCDRKMPKVKASAI